MTWRLHAHVTFTETETGAVLLDTHRGRYWQMNGTAAVVVRHLVQEGDVQSAVADLCERYPESTDDVVVDIQRVVEELRAAGLVTS
jgi:Coenzyme PQQ synthesis protein D (PqqD)